MKTLFYFFSNNLNGEIWLDENGEFINYIHENDGYYKSEYYDFIPKRLGGRVVFLNGESLDEKIFADKKDYDDAEELVSDYKDFILGMITKKTKGRKNVKRVK